MENKEIRKANLEQLIEIKRSELGLTKASFAELCDISPATLSQMLGPNPRRNIGDKMARKIESSLELPLGWMDKTHHDVHEVIDNENLEVAGFLQDGVIPVIGDAVLGMDGLIDMVEFHAGWLRFYSADPKAYAVRVRGDSMWPRMQSGEFVVIEPGTKVHPGDEVFVRTSDGHNMIKIMNVARDGDYQFISVNSDHKPITIAPDNVAKIHFVSGIIKATRFISFEEVNRIDLLGGSANSP